MSDAPNAPRRNLELKVRLTREALADLRQELRAWLDAEPETQHQRDRYFRVPEGRLKLRTITYDTGAFSGELIAYRRADIQGPRWSAYHITPVTADQVEHLATTLGQVLPLLVEVRKRREITLAGATRVHLDEVDGLGAFAELETVIAGQSDAGAEREHEAVIARLGLEAWPVEARSYSDLMQASRAPDCAEPNGRQETRN